MKKKLNMVLFNIVAAVLLPSHSAHAEQVDMSNPLSLYKLALNRISIYMPRTGIIYVFAREAKDGNETPGADPKHCSSKAWEFGFMNGKDDLPKDHRDDLAKVTVYEQAFVTSGPRGQWTYECDPRASFNIKGDSLLPGYGGMDATWNKLISPATGIEIAQKEYADPISVDLVSITRSVVPPPNDFVQFQYVGTGCGTKKKHLDIVVNAEAGTLSDHTSCSD